MVRPEDPCPVGTVEVWENLPSSGKVVMVPSNQNCPPGFIEDTSGTPPGPEMWIPGNLDCPPGATVAVVGQTLAASSSNSSTPTDDEGPSSTSSGSTTMGGSGNASVTASGSNGKINAVPVFSGFFSALFAIAFLFAHDGGL